VLIEALNTPLSLSVIVNVLALLYVNPVTNVSLSVIPVNPLPSPTKVPLNVPPLNVVADILPDV
jgi:hypothetical protein